MTPLRIVFAGTPGFSRPALLGLIAQGHHVTACFTQPDRPAGRGRQMTPSVIRVTAEQAGIPVFTPQQGADMQAVLATLGPVDVMVVAAYGLILPAGVLAAPRLGCLNIHASLLPRWRGAAPVARAIEAGDPVTGVTIMLMDEGLDTGGMISTATVPIRPGDTTETLTAELARTGADLLVATLPEWAEGRLPVRPQPAEGRCYARKLAKTEAPLDWRQPAVVLERKIRAFAPWPGSTAGLGADTVKVIRGHVVDRQGPPGEILALGDGVTVGTGEGALVLTHLQQAGKPAQPAGVVARRLGWHPGDGFAGGACAKP
ncbi:MAG: methionyl-tRNA formyltransferase [Gammaproteobacteria bacterium]|nr:methionyl-tRNA formyltransferase [Gammaproteobacteria bacterium]